MTEKIKWYFFEIVLKKYGPIGITAALTAIGTYLAAHAGVLEQYGVTYGNWPLHWNPGQDPSGHVILIELDTLGAAAYTAIIAAIAVLIRAIQQHTTGTPMFTGGTRAGDPPSDSPMDPRTGVAK
jgi:hypothetical protein